MGAPPGACDVLVVGLGPVGLLLTALLRAQGRDVVGVERDAGIRGEPRAAVLDDEALRALQAVGVAGGVVGDGVVQEAAELRLRDGRTVTLMHTPARTANGHPALVGIHQPDVEERLEREAGPCVFRGLEATGLQRAGPAVTVTLRDVATGESRTVSARWVVGCDGARSAVRRLAGIPFGGTTFAQRWLVVDAAVTRTGRPRATFTGNPAAPAVTLPLTPAIRRWEVMVGAGTEADPAIVRRLARPEEGEATPLRAAIYTFHARMAARWRAGRVLLAGDAAHVMPPFAGQGLGSGLRDAVNLAWKLGAVLEGRAGPQLLDTYETERRPHVLRLTALARFVGAIVQTRRPRLATARDAALLALDRTAVGARLQAGGAKPPATLRRGAVVDGSRGAGTLLPQPLVRTGDGPPAPLDDVLGRGWALLASEPPPVAAPRAVVLARDVADPSGVLERWLARHHAAVALVRPDRHVAGTATRASDAPALVAAVGGLVSG
jgi:3-(3-hydroxy-phenyl)propionate hydroxylase